MTKGSTLKVVTLSRTLITKTINHAQQLIEWRKCGKRYIGNGQFHHTSRRGRDSEGYTPVIARLPDNTQGLPCYSCREFMPPDSKCVSRKSTSYTVRHYYHMDCAEKYHVWP